MKQSFLGIAAVSIAWIIVALMASLVLLLGILLPTMVGTFIGWIVGYFAPFVMKLIVSVVPGLAPFALWQIGGTLGFFAGVWNVLTRSIVSFRTTNATKA